jgi:small subunit ribosomal protein S18
LEKIQRRRKLPTRRKTRGRGGKNNASKRLRSIFAKKKVCRLCLKKVNEVDYKDTALLKGFMADSGRILPRKTTGNCPKHQRLVAREIKRARNAGLLPFMNR